MLAGAAVAAGAVGLVGKQRRAMVAFASMNAFVRRSLAATSLSTVLFF